MPNVKTSEWISVDSWYLSGSDAKWGKAFVEGGVKERSKEKEGGRKEGT